MLRAIIKTKSRVLAVAVVSALLWMPEASALDREVALDVINGSEFLPIQMTVELPVGDNVDATNMIQGMRWLLTSFRRPAQFRVRLRSTHGAS